MALRRVDTPLPGLVIVEPLVHADERGFFAETYRADELGALGIDEDWVQDNHARSTRGVRRGLHFAVPPGQAKLVRCARGAVFDACVDLRRGSPTFGRSFGTVLDDVDLRMLYVPVGFAHGYQVLSESADVVYRCSGYYDPAAERELDSGDPALAIPWPDGPVRRSDRDRRAPRLADVAETLPFTFAP